MQDALPSNISGLLPDPRTNAWKDKSGLDEDAYTAEDGPAMKKLRSVMSSPKSV